MNRLALIIATAGYTGYVPFAPGTIGSLVGLAVYAALIATHAPLAVPAAVVVLATAGVWAATRAERHFSSIDPGPVVIDEVVGMLVSLAWIDASATTAVAGFLLFRIFDIVKPFPAARLERLGGGVGIVADDVMAGAYANVSLRVLLAIAPGWFA